MTPIKEIEIIEVLGRSTQGATKPFLCRGIDGHTYYVKGHSAGRASLIRELLASQFAVLMNIPIAPFAIVDVPEELILPRFRADIRDLGHGLAFGSQVSQHVVELSYSQLQNALFDERISRQTAKDIFMFDWWTCNEDRTLFDGAGNPNLLWDHQADRLVVIDHNLAFDTDFQSDSALQFHVFADAGRQVFSDFIDQQCYCARFQKALDFFDAALANIPAEWFWVDHDVPAAFSIETARTMLGQFETDGFWRGQR